MSHDPRKWVTAAHAPDETLDEADVYAAAGIARPEPAPLVPPRL
jgi:hypothetical protein